MARTARAIQKVTQVVDRSIPTMAAIPTTTHIRIGSVVLLLLIIYLQRPLSNGLLRPFCGSSHRHQVGKYTLFSPLCPTRPIRGRPPVRGIAPSNRTSRRPTRPPRPIRQRARRRGGTPCGCPFPSHRSEGRSPDDPWIRCHKRSRDPARVSHYQARPGCATRKGSMSRGRSTHRSSPLSRLDQWLWSGDPCRDP